MTEYVDKPPYIAPEEPSGPCDWLESCWEPSTDWRRDPETRGFVPVCEAHSVSTELRAPLDWVSLELSLALEAHLRDRDKWRAEVATLTTERDGYRADSERFEWLAGALDFDVKLGDADPEEFVTEENQSPVDAWRKAVDCVLGLGRAEALAGTGETG